MTLDLKKYLKPRGPRQHDVVGVDLGSSGTKAVRLRLMDGKPRLTAAAQLPATPYPADAAEAARSSGLALPGVLHARYVALALSAPEAVAKLLVVPRPADKLGDFAFSGMLGLANPDAFRIGVEIESSTHGETTVLAAAIPDHMVRWALHLFPVATPAPCSAEIAGLAALNAIAYSLREKPAEGAAMAIDIGARTSTLGIFIRQDLALMRQFPIGSNAIMNRVAGELGMDEETARSVLTDDVIDASDAIRIALEPLVRQLMLGRDFVARHRNCRVANVYLAGGLSGSPFWRQHIAALLGFEPNDWNPLTIVPCDPAVASPDRTSASGCFAAAMGAALAALEAS